MNALDTAAPRPARPGIKRDPVRPERPGTRKPAARKPARKRASGTHSRMVPSIGHRPVMVVDDDEDLLLNARMILEKHGFEVVTRTSAPDWQDLQHTAPCVVFMDINLGRENGILACQAIKRSPPFQARSGDPHLRDGR